MDILKLELLADKHWEETYNKMVLKQGICKEDKDLLWKTKELNKNNIVDDIMSGNYEWSIPRKVEIAKSETGKKRVVYMYSIVDRYILGVMYRAISNYFRDTISDNCFSYKKGTSTNDAIRYIRENKSEKFKYGVKIDIHSYFNSVSKDRVIEMIDALFYAGLKTSIEKLMLDTRVEWKGQIINEWKSLIPGCAFGSFFANYCLRDCDAYFEDKLTNDKCIYARYSDDIIILAETKEELSKYLHKVKEFINKYGLVINEKKYTWFEPGDDVEYLGLKLRGDGKIDISDHAKQKIKKQIHRWCRKGRMEIERDGAEFEKVAKRIIRQLNNKNFKCYIKNEATFGWCHYCFRYITTVDSLREIDLYTKDTIRALKTGKHNKANYKAITEEEFHRLGWVSLVELYKLYKSDFDYYCEVIELI